jgi:hypothetical protein
MRFKLSSRAAAATLAALLAGAAAPAHAQQSIASFTTANVIEALAAVGVTDGQAKKGSSPNGTPFDYVGFSTGGVRHVAILEVCNTGTPGCLGLNLLTIWNDAGAVVDRNKINDFNATYSFGKGFVAGNSLIFQRYAISDGGVSKANVQSNIGNFVVLGQAFAGAVGGSGSAGTISAKPGDAALVRTSLSSEAEAIVEMMGDDNPNLWNAPRTAPTMDGITHAQPK